MIDYFEAMFLASFEACRQSATVKVYGQLFWCASDGPIAPPHTRFRSADLFRRNRGNGEQPNDPNSQLYFVHFLSRGTDYTLASEVSLLLLEWGRHVHAGEYARARNEVDSFVLVLCNTITEAPGWQDSVRARSTAPPPN
jgi:hypothetical protein